MSAYQKSLKIFSVPMLEHWPNLDHQRILLSYNANIPQKYCSTKPPVENVSLKKESVASIRENGAIKEGP